MVVCGKPRFQDNQFDTLLTPTVLFEILSPSTEDDDRGRKFLFYRGIESLREYVVLAQNRPAVERYKREGDEWRLSAWDSIDATVRLDSIDVSIPLAEVYARVEFPTAGEDGRP